MIEMNHVEIEWFSFEDHTPNHNILNQTSIAALIRRTRCLLANPLIRIEPCSDKPQRNILLNP